MKNFHKLVAGATLLASGAAVPAYAEVSANLGVASQYIFRGVNFGSPQVSGGVDWAGSQGLYAGFWGSSAGGEQENDFYAGWANDSVDLGVIYYAFPDSPTAEAYEAYASASVGGLGLAAWWGFVGFTGADDDEYVYVEANYDHELSEKATLSFHLGYNEPYGADDADGIFDAAVTLGLGDFYVMASYLDFDSAGKYANPGIDSQNNERPTITVGYSWSFDEVM